MSSVTQTDDAAARTGRILWALGLVLLLCGWLSILHVYRWHLTAPVFFLWTGWAALLLSARALFRAAMAAAEDTGDVDDDFWKPVGRREELLLEKRSLLKAIKEIEFDREMGKMSEADAAELTRFYRQRAIEIIKALEGEGGEALSVKEQIERELKARLAVAGAGGKGKARAARKADQASETKAGASTDAKADAQPEARTETRADAAPGTEADQAPEAKAGAEAQARADQASEAQAEAAPQARADQASEARAEPKAGAKAGAKKKSGRKKKPASRQPGAAAGGSSEQAEPGERAAAAEDRS